MRKILSIFISIMLLISVIALKQDVSLAQSQKFNMTFLYGGNSQTYLKNIEATDGSLDMVSPSYFDINLDGTLKVVNVDTDFIKQVHSKGIKVMPFLSNHWNRDLGKTALENRVVLVDELVLAINKYNLDGISVDIENLTPEDKDNLTDLVRLLKERLSSDKEISMCVSANSGNYTTGWHGSYDYNELPKFCDYLIVMAYDESAGSMTPRAGASYNFVEKSIKYLIDKKVPSEKIVLAMPFYGRYWSDRDTEIKGNSIHLTAVENLIEKFNSTVIFDKNNKSPMIKFTITENGPQANIGGKNLTPGEYTVWYENNDSIKAKLELVNKYNLKGAGSWRLGQENLDLWNYYSLWLNDKYFKDIENHWAERDIVYNIKNKLMVGMSKDEFSPNGNLTRAQSAVVLSNFLNLEIDSIEGNTSDFSDVDNSHWAYKYISAVKSSGLISGFEDNSFKPDQALTREQMSTILDKMLAVEIEIYGNPYSDLSKDRWSYKSIMKMTELGILKGYENNEFRPVNKITRAEMASLMYRLDK